MKHKIEFHKYANIFPMIEGKELESLAADIAANGLNNPVVIFEGKILDGRNRYRACELANITPATREFEGDNGAAIKFVMSENMERRHLNSGQKAIVAVKLGEILAEIEGAARAEAAKRMKAGKKLEPRQVNIDKDVQPSAINSAGSKKDRESAVKTAKALGTNRDYLSHAKTLVERHPEKASKVEKGEITMTQAMREVRKEEATSKVSALPSDKYRVIYADPPWSYGNSGVIGENDNYGHVERHYPSMTIQQLCDMGINEITEANAVLFLWVTSPLLAECFPVIRAWGFKYKTSFVWDKVGHNFGHYNSVRHEFLLVCTKGSCTPEVKELHDSVVVIEKSKKHSEKPEYFRELIDKLYPSGKRIELFARAKADGWEAYGNEV